MNASPEATLRPAKRKYVRKNVPAAKPEVQSAHLTQAAAPTAPAVVTKPSKRRRFAGWSEHKNSKKPSYFTREGLAAYPKGEKFEVWILTDKGALDQVKGVYADLSEVPDSSEN